jgi:hypothetical protein
VLSDPLPNPEQLPSQAAQSGSQPILCGPEVWEQSSQVQNNDEEPVGWFGCSFGAKSTSCVIVLDTHDIILSEISP